MSHDMRFAKDKTPDRTTVSGVLSPSGPIDALHGVVWPQIDPEVGFIAEGFYKLEPAKLKRFLLRIAGATGRCTDILKGLAAKVYNLNVEAGIK